MPNWKLIGEELQATAENHRLGRFGDPLNTKECQDRIALIASEVATRWPADWKDSTMKAICGRAIVGSNGAVHVSAEDLEQAAAIALALHLDDTLAPAGAFPGPTTTSSPGPAGP